MSAAVRAAVAAPAPERFLVVAERDPADTAGGSVAPLFAAIATEAVIHGDGDAASLFLPESARAVLGVPAGDIVACLPLAARSLPP